MKKAFYPLLNTAQFLFATLWSVICISVAFVIGLITFRRDFSLGMARWLYTPPLIAMTGTKVELEPLPDVDWSKPHVYLMNHQSMADIVVAFAKIPANLRFVAKHNLKYVPFIGWYMWFTGMIFINRSDRRAAFRSIREAGERIRAGANIIAYPEGTRSRDGTILPFKKGPFMLALEAKVPIIPVVIDGSGKVMPRDGLRLRKGTIRLKLGEPIETAHYKSSDREALMRQTREIMIRMHREIGGAGGDADAVDRSASEDQAS